MPASTPQGPPAASPSSTGGAPSRWPSGRGGGPTWLRLLCAAIVGLLAGLLLGQPLTWQYGLLLGWVAAAAVFVLWAWVILWPLDASATAARAVQEDPGRATTDVIILSSAVASLGAVGLLLLGGSQAGGSRDLQALVSVVGVALAWAAVHTTFTTRYARLYYAEPVGGVDFNEPDPPRYRDFAYLAFTIGMAFQVSDTQITTKDVRATVLRHALFSYVFGAVVIAATINLVAGLGH